MGKHASSVTTPSDAQQEACHALSTKTEDGRAISPGIADNGTEPKPASLNYAAAVSQGGISPSAAKALPLVTKIAGGWKPRQLNKLLETLAKEWATTSRSSDSAEQEKLREVAMTETEIRLDDALRQRTEMETKALLAYLNGTLEIPHAPVFLKATMPLIQRAMMEQFHESHVEFTLTADVSPAAKLRRSMTHIALFRLLHQANADSERGKQLIDRLMDDVKILHFDGIHTLKFVFHSRRVAEAYQGAALRLQGTYLELDPADEGADARVMRTAQLRRRYALRIHHAEAIGLVALVATLGTLPGVCIIDAERPRLDSTEVVDNRYVLLRFDGQNCPQALRGVTKVDMGGTVVTVHHHLIHPRTVLRAVSYHEFLPSQAYTSESSAAQAQESV
jgi:hypothetical protein